MATTQSVIERHIEAFNAHDPAADPWHADAEIVAPGASVTGREDVLGFLGVFQEAFPDGRLSISRLIVDGSDAAAEGTFSGTHDGVLRTPNGDVSPTGRSVEFRWAAAYEVSGEALLSEHLYFDQADFATQLGL